MLITISLAWQFSDFSRRGVSFSTMGCNGSTISLHMFIMFSVLRYYRLVPLGPRPYGSEGLLYYLGRLDVVMLGLGRLDVVVLGFGLVVRGVGLAICVVHLYSVKCLFIRYDCVTIFVLSDLIVLFGYLVDSYDATCAYGVWENNS